MSNDEESYQRQGRRNSRYQEWNEEREPARENFEHQRRAYFASPRRSEGFGNPRAHSTAGSAFRNRDRNEARERSPRISDNRPATNTMMTSANSSRAGGSKMFKVDPFPKAVKPTDQYQEWSYWLANFEMAIEKAETTE